MMNRLFGLILVSGCLTQTLTASQLATTAQTSTALASPPMEDTEQSSQEVEIALPTNAIASLDAYKWKKRLLLVFAPKQDAAYQRQMQLFKDQQAGFTDRDLLVVHLLAEGTSRIDSESIDALATEIRKRFNVGQQEFQIILVGKDGTSKRRDRVPVPPTVIFNEIDAMPMRQQEMRSRRN